MSLTALWILRVVTEVPDAEVGPAPSAIDGLISDVHNQS